MTFVIVLLYAINLYPLDIVGSFFVTTPFAEMTKGYVDNIVKLPDTFDFQGKFSYFVILSPSILESLWVNKTVYLLQVLNCSPYQ